MTERSIRNSFVIFLLWAFFAQAVTSMVVKSPTVDERVHLTRGYVYLELGDLRFMICHPVLANALNALPLWALTDLPLPTDDPSWLEGRGVLFSDRFVWQPGNDVDLIFFLSRLVTVALGMLLAALVFRWARELWGARSAQSPSHPSWGGVVALALFVFDPTIVAHSRFVTNDIAVSFFFFAATYALWRYLESPFPFRCRYQRLLGAGVLFGLSQATKFSALLLAPVFLLLIGLWPFLDRSRTRPTSSHWLWWALRTGLALFIVGGLTLWAVYRFEFHPLTGGRWPLPAPAYWEELRSLYFGRERYAFLAGRISSTGWWYYFPIAFLIKTPLPALLLIGRALLIRGNVTSTSLSEAEGTPGPDQRRVAALLIPVVVYLLPVLLSPMQIGYRHLIPVLPYLYVLTGRGMGHRGRNQLGLSSLRAQRSNLLQILRIKLRIKKEVSEKPALPVPSGAGGSGAGGSGAEGSVVEGSADPSADRQGSPPPQSWGGLRGGYWQSFWPPSGLVRAIQRERTSHCSSFIVYCSLAMLVWSAMIALCIHPHYLAYFNALAGGPDNGWRYLVDSNIDWGQDLPALHDVVERHNLGRIKLSYFGTTPPSYYGLDFEPLPTWSETPEQGNPSTRTYYPYDPSPGIYAISASHLQGVVMHPDQWDTYAWFRDKPPFAKAGYSIFLYQVEPTGPPVDVALSGLQVDELAPETFAAFGSNDIRLRWFDARTSLVIPSQPGWYAVLDVDDFLRNRVFSEKPGFYTHPCTTTAGSVVIASAAKQSPSAQACRLYPPDPSAHAAAMTYIEYLSSVSRAWHSPAPVPSPPELGGTGGGDEQISPLALPINLSNQLEFLGYKPHPVLSVVEGTDPSHSPFRNSQLAIRNSQFANLLTAWRVTAPPDGPRAIFVHLLTPDGQIAAQWDGLDVPVEGWREGDTILQVASFELPADLPPGQYWLQTGVYNPATMERLSVLVDGTSIADRILLSPVRVLPPRVGGD